MNLHYAKHTHYVGEEQEYKTWEWVQPESKYDPDVYEPEYEWRKKRTPNFSCGEVAGGAVDQEKVNQANEYFKTSCREDLIFLEKESTECQYWYDAEKKEIYLAQKNLN